MQGIDWRGVWTIATGYEPEVEFVEPYVASLLFFFINMTTGIVLRCVLSALLSKHVSGYALDFVSTMESCAYFFENNFVLKHYGNIWFGVAIVVQCFVCSRTFGNSSENPIKALHELMAKEIVPGTAVVKILVQTLAGLASYYFARLFWSLDLISDHHERYYETSCESDLQVTLLMGFIIEMCASLSDTWFGMQTVAASPLLDELIKYINAATMITIGVTTTGMYFNPAMASGHTLGCHGTALWEHFFVYWAGPFIGCFVAIHINRFIHFDVNLKNSSVTEGKKNK